MIMRLTSQLWIPNCIRSSVDTRTKIQIVPMTTKNEGRKQLKINGIQKTNIECIINIKQVTGYAGCLGHFIVVQNIVI